MKRVQGQSLDEQAVAAVPYRGGESLEPLVDEIGAMDNNARESCRKRLGKPCVAPSSEVVWEWKCERNLTVAGNEMLSRNSGC